jgi:hypothetical protein
LGKERRRLCHPVKDRGIDNGIHLIRRGAFRSVKDLKVSIAAFLTAWNKDPQPFIWTATVEFITEKLSRETKIASQIRYSIYFYVVTRQGRVIAVLSFYPRQNRFMDLCALGNFPYCRSP